MVITELLKIINEIREFKGLPELDTINHKTTLRYDCELDSFDLAELTVKIEANSGKDIFQDGIVENVGEILSQFNKTT
jgi:acyl carrier protein